MRLSFLKKRLFAPLYGSFTILVLLLLAREGLSLSISILRQRSVDSITQTFKIKRESERLMGAALEEKVALRGYLLNPNPALLRQYKEGEAVFQDSLEQLFSLLKKDLSQQQKIIKITDFYDQWKIDFAQPTLNNSLSLELMEQASSLDPLREIINSILIYEQGVLSEQNQRLKQLDRLNQVSLGLSYLSISIIILGSGFNFILLRRRVVAPLQKLVQAGNAWKLGQLSTRIDHASEDEMGLLSQTLNGMAKGIQIRQGTIQQRNEQLEDLISALSHDLRTPLLANRSTLNAIAGGAFGSISHELQDVLWEYREANDDLINLVEALLDISRYETQGEQILTHRPLNWAKICQRVSNWIQTSSQEKCKLQIHISPNLAPIQGDSIEIQRVLQNLVDNAVRLSPISSTVLINITQQAGGPIEVAVQDQGPGLAEPESKTVFYRFAKGAERKGRAGLGLYLCRQIIEAHGGKIWVESILGEGATFRFNLPVMTPEDKDATTTLIHCSA